MIRFYKNGIKKRKKTIASVAKACENNRIRYIIYQKQIPES